MRISSKERNTNETQINLKLNLDGNGQRKINTEFKFFNHMLEQLAAHGGFDIELDAKSLDGDAHHIVEDVAITLGQAFKEALRDKKGINRYGSFLLPMDEALVLSVVDISNRPFCKVDVSIKDERTSDFETVLLAHFFNSLALNMGATIHIKMLDGIDTHHIIEACFKSFARALSQACQINQKFANSVPSTKGVL